MTERTPEELLEGLRGARSDAASAAGRLDDSAAELLAHVTKLEAERERLRAALADALDALPPSHPVYLQHRRLLPGRAP
jgi:thioredoxin-like negative regulator of GroEL